MIIEGNERGGGALYLLFVFFLLPYTLALRTFALDVGRFLPCGNVKFVVGTRGAWEAFGGSIECVIIEIS